MEVEFCSSPILRILLGRVLLLSYPSISQRQKSSPLCAILTALSPLPEHAPTQRGNAPVADDRSIAARLTANAACPRRRGDRVEAMLRMSPVVAHRDLASRIHVRSAAESGQARTDVNEPSRLRVAW
jgi:hypothetical protein